MSGKNKKTEHSGAKNGGGYWGPRSEAKAVSKKARRGDAKKLAQGSVEGEFSSGHSDVKMPTKRPGFLLRG